MYPLIRLGPNTVIPTYFLVIAMAYCVCVYWVSIRSDKYNLPKKNMMDLCLLLMVTGFVGARAFHVIYEMPEYYIKKPMEIFKFWNGGFVFYGGVIGAAISTALYTRLKKLDVKKILSTFAPIIPLGYAIGRFATLLSGSGYGRPSSLPWAIIYPTGTEAPAGIALHPTPIYSMLWSLMGVVIVLLLQKGIFKKALHKAFFIMVMLHGFGRIIMEQFRDDFRGGALLGLSVSSWISITLILGAVYFLLFPLEKQYNKASS